MEQVAKMRSKVSCPICGHLDSQQVMHIESVPALCNQLGKTRSAAQSAPMASMDIVACRNCAMIWNKSFCSEIIEYEPEYENALHYSPRFREYAGSLTADLTERYGLRGLSILEIGCGDGFLLDRMLRQGVAHAVGFDPSLLGRTTSFTKNENITVISKEFDESARGIDFDFLICRHVLEHIEDPISFLRATRSAIGDRDIPVYFEVPNAKWILEDFSVFDFIFEHFGYWSEPSIDTAFRLSGFRPVSIREVYGKQFLGVEALPCNMAGALEEPVQEGIDDIISIAERFSDRYQSVLSYWSDRLQKSQTSVVWGAGSKGISFSNMMGMVGGQIEALVDLNPRKQGLFSPGMALPIVAPPQLVDIAPEIILVANSLYFDEIKDMIAQIIPEAACEMVIPSFMQAEFP